MNKNIKNIYLYLQKNPKKKNKKVRTQILTFECDIVLRNSIYLFAPSFKIVISEINVFTYKICINNVSVKMEVVAMVIVW